MAPTPAWAMAAGGAAVYSRELRTTRLTAFMTSDLGPRATRFGPGSRTTIASLRSAGQHFVFGWPRPDVYLHDGGFQSAAGQRGPPGLVRSKGEVMADMGQLLLG